MLYPIGIAVVHLVRKKNGVEILQRFVDSYKKNPGGLAHDLIVIMKGFDTSDLERDKCLELLQPLEHQVFYVSDDGFDITAYQKVVNKYQTNYKYFCFLNSFSKFRDPEWLSKLYNSLLAEGVGLVGATGSWQSIGSIGATGSWQSIGSIGATGSWQNYLPVAWIVYLRKKFSGFYPNKVWWRRLILAFLAVIKRLGLHLYFPKFPNYHVRSNAFFISREVFMKLAIRPIKSKRDAYRFESGRRSLTRQVLKLGLKVLVVGKDGLGYEMNLWDQSRTFWQYEQENLLVEDNQTGVYQKALPEHRYILSNNAWNKYHYDVEDESIK